MENEIVIPPANVASSSSKDSSGKKPELPAHSSIGHASSDDDWEAKANFEPDELLSTVPSDCLSGVSNLKLEDTKTQTPKRRGRGKFLYEKGQLYSDQVLDGLTTDVEDEETRRGSKDKRDIQNLKYGTGHVLVLADFAPSTKESDLQKLFEDFKDHGLVIRWVNETVALAVFRTPSIALEAKNNVRCSFTVRILEEDDVLLSSIEASDLEPPLQRPKTSAQTARRMIAHSMGVDPSSLSGGSPSKGSPREHKKQEGVRKERIVTRQKLRDDAWGEE